MQHEDFNGKVKQNPANKLLGSPDWREANTGKKELKEITVKVPEFLHQALRGIEDNFIKEQGNMDAHACFCLAFGFGDCLSVPYMGTIITTVGEASENPTSAAHQHQHQVEAVAAVVAVATKSMHDHTMAFSQRLNVLDRLDFLRQSSHMLNFYIKECTQGMLEEEEDQNESP